jgi:nucleotide-binding universal stress UspA family protein
MVRPAVARALTNGHHVGHPTPAGQRHPAPILHAPNSTIGVPARYCERVFELGTDGPRTILVGIDGSDTSLRAGAYAAGLARRQGAQLIFLFVHVLKATFAPEVVPALRAAQDSTFAELRANIEEQAGRLGLAYQLYEREGNPYREITRLANELRVDAVVVGASMRAGHRLVGSLAARLVRDARWPITVVP